MEDLLSKIYDKIVFYEKDGMKCGKEFDTVVSEILKPLKESRTEEEIEEIRELVYQAAYSAEKYGFYVGVRFVVRFFAEIWESGMRK